MDDLVKKTAEYVGLVGGELDKGDRSFILGDRTSRNHGSVWYLVPRAIALSF
ncbi:hypothetical protein [Microcoleus sp. CAWBG58]|uniref:hypothetical protein n=1 Tax=Microcoleus sp. CAWBG58 TaxID=2841651 RepID=UPI0025CF2627|nr:hypothetical protein [Microcoleus sp. CAWBG58]